MSRLLVVEDEPVIRTALRRLLERNGYEVTEAGDVVTAREAITRYRPELVIADLRLPDASGTELISATDDIPVLIMTSYASVRSAVESMKQGAVDYIAKPFDHDEMLLSVERILRNRRLLRQNQALKSDVARDYPVAGMIGRCPAMQAVFARIEEVSTEDKPVLILGESGTGKELVARAVHDKSSRHDAPMVTVNCGSLPSARLEAELFGPQQESYTGAPVSAEGLVELADGGHLFLDQIEELPLSAQASLVNALEQGYVRHAGALRPRRVNIRLIAASDRDLKNRVAEGVFREDLHARLHESRIVLPALRERGDDITELAQALLEKCCHKMHRAALGLHSDSLKALKSYGWPGNVRELENAIERAVILCEGTEVTPELLSLGSGTADALIRAGISLEQYFLRFVEMHQATFTETELAEQLGISRKALWERRQRLAIPRPKGRV